VQTQRRSLGVDYVVTQPERGLDNSGLGHTLGLDNTKVQQQGARSKGQDRGQDQLAFQENKEVQKQTIVKLTRKKKGGRDELHRYIHRHTVVYEQPSINPCMRWIMEGLV
jgi:hypothetical protein